MLISTLLFAPMAIRVACYSPIQGLSIDSQTRTKDSYVLRYDGYPYVRSFARFGFKTTLLGVSSRNPNAVVTKWIYSDQMACDKRWNVLLSAVGQNKLYLQQGPNMGFRGSACKVGENMITRVRSGIEVVTKDKSSIHHFDGELIAPIDAIGLDEWIQFTYRVQNENGSVIVTFDKKQMAFERHKLRLETGEPANLALIGGFTAATKRSSLCLIEAMGVRNSHFDIASAEASILKPKDWNYPCTLATIDNSTGIVRPLIDITFRKDDYERPRHIPNRLMFNLSDKTISVIREDNLIVITFGEVSWL